MRKLFSMIVAALVCVSAMAEIQRPKLVVGLVVDQMRWDYLYYYYDQYGEGGLRKLVDEGFSFENTMINYVPTITAIGHTSIYTGTTPALHGICGNDFYINGKRTYHILGLGCYSRLSACFSSKRELRICTPGCRIISINMRHTVYEFSKLLEVLLYNQP